MTDARFSLTASRYFASWLLEQRSAIAFTTYQANKLFLVGARPDGSLSVFERTFPRCMGLFASTDASHLLLASEYQIYRLDNVMQGSDTAGSQQQVRMQDAKYVPHASWITGDLDVHDIAQSGDGRPVFVNTLFNCISTVSEGHSFRVTWMPPFISKLAAEDRCHLNGLAMEDGTPAYATASAATDVADGWRDRRTDGGVLLSVPGGETVASGLSMPHSPRIYAGRVWLLNSGTGDFTCIDPATGKLERVAFIPGFARGLAFSGGYAVIGMSLPRESRTFSGLPIESALAARNADARCGIAVVDTRSGDMAHWLRIDGVVRELYDVAVLNGVGVPTAVGFVTDEIKRVISIEA